MTTQDNHIDKRVKDSFSEYRVSPPTGIWNRLEQSIEIQRHARIMLIRRRIILVAAVMAAFITGYFFATINYNSELIVADTTVSTLPAKSNEQEIFTAGKQSDQPEVAASSLEQMERKVSNAGMRKETDIITQAQQPVVAQTPVLQGLPATMNLAEIEYVETVLISHLDIPTLKPGFLIPVIGSVKTTKDPVNYLIPDVGAPSSPTQNRWSIAGMAGQTYANYYQGINNQSIDGVYQHSVVSTTQEKITSPLASFTLAVDYNLSSRFGISSGLASHNFSTPLHYGSMEKVTLNNQKPLVNAFGVIELNDEIRNDISKSPNQTVNSEQFEQSFSYFEIPMTATYRIIDRKIGLGVKAGLGGNFLTDNKVILHMPDGESDVLGETDGVRDFYLSGIFSLDLSLKIFNKWHASFTPVYRHAIQPVSNTSLNPHTFSVGLYSGLRYRF